VLGFVCGFKFSISCLIRLGALILGIYASSQLLFPPDVLFLLVGWSDFFVSSD
jgi:hypothetical protein